MAVPMDFQNFGVTVSGNVSKTLPEIMVSLQVTDSTTNQVLFDFTGANSFSIWTAFAGLSAADKREVVMGFIRDVINKRAGIT